MDSKLLPNRLATYATIGAALLAALAPILADLDWESTAGIIAGISAITAVVYKWLDGWSKWERGVGDGLLGGVPSDEPPFDEAGAEPIPPTVSEAAHVPEGTTLQAKKPPA